MYTGILLSRKLSMDLLAPSLASQYSILVSNPLTPVPSNFTCCEEREPENNPRELVHPGNPPWKPIQISNQVE